jgi:predicted nuclease of predicted toxin-antitoxin system
VSLPYCFDQHVPGPARDGLRLHGVDVLTTEEDAAKRTPDESLFERATRLGRVMVTNDEDFLVIASNWLAEGRHFSGLVRLRDQYIPYGKLIEDLLLIAEAYEPHEMDDRIEYLPF